MLRWLEILRARAPNAVVQLVVSKVDAAEDAGDAVCAWVRKGVDKVLAKWKALHETQTRQQRDGGAADRTHAAALRSLRIQPATLRVSSVAGKHFHLVAEASDTIVDLTRQQGLLPAVGQKVPVSWQAVIEVVRALRDGRAPADAVAALLHGEPAAAAAAAEYSVEGRVYAMYDEIARVRSEAVRSCAEAATDTDASTLRAESNTVLDDAIMLMEAQGEILTSAGMVFLQPSFLMDLLKPLFEHRMQKKNVAKYVARRKKSMQKFSRYDTDGSACLESALEALISKAELREELLPFLWKDVGHLKAEHHGRVIETLVDSGVLFPLTAVEGTAAAAGESARRWIMPTRLPRLEPRETAEAWNKERNEEGVYHLALSLTFWSSFVPPGFMERIIASCHSYGNYQGFWAAGALIKASVCA